MCWLILGGRSNGLAVARAIDSPSNVYVLDFCEKTPVTAFSRYVKEVFIIDRAFQSVASFLDIFLSENKAVLIATDDWWVHQVSKYREWTDRAFYGFFPAQPLLQRILDKKALYEFLHDDIKVPVVVSPQEVIDLDDYIVKPRLSFNEDGVVEKGVNSFSKYQGMGVDALIQKKITAPLESHLSVCGIRIGGKILFPFCSRKVMEFPCPMGTATMVQNVHDSFLINKLLGQASLVFSRLDYTGIFELEFIAHQGEFWFIDFNPRFWLQHGMAIDAGINYARLYSELSKDANSIDSMNMMPKYSKKLVWLHEGAPLSFISSRQKLRVLGMLISSKITFAHFKINDMKPFWYFLLCKLKR